MKSKWEVTITAVICTLIGIGCGVMMAGGFESKSESAGETVQADELDLSPATLENLGVRTQPIQTTTFYRTVSVAAVIEETPTTEQPVFAPIGGRVASIEVERGTRIDPGATVVTLIRDPLPRPQLVLTADVLRPAQERLHENVLALRSSAEELRIARTELERVEKFTESVGEDELPVIPRQRTIDLRYQLSRAQKAHEQARLEFAKHGLTEAQVADIEGGAPLPSFNEASWQRALARNGLWPAEARKLSAVLPDSLRALPWVTATVAELAAGGLATPELTEWMANEDVASHFLEFGVLLQQGHTLEDLKRLHALNALAPVVRVLAPDLADNGAWDVHDVLVRRGARVAAGDRLVILHDNRDLLLRAEPVGGEVVSVLEAAAEGRVVTAKPLIRGSGPLLKGLRIQHVESSMENEGTIAYAELENEVLSELAAENGAVCRTWALREGLRYILSVPTDRLENVFVLPATAVTDDGPNSVVFLRDGDGFLSVPVSIAYQDHEVVVIRQSPRMELFPGDIVVHSGAFELGMALKGGDAVDASHHGHSH